MQIDALTSSAAPVLTGIAAGATGYSDVIDLSVYRDLSAASLPVSVQFGALPTSATGGATLNVALQTSADNVTFTTLEETAPQPLTNFTSANPWAFRGTVNAGGQRYLRFAYTPSAVLTAGALLAQVGADWPRSNDYPRNYVA